MNRFAHLGLLLLAFALAGRIALPPGLMVDTGSGAARIVICSGTGAGSADALIDFSKGGKPAKGEPGDKACTGAAPLLAAAEVGSTGQQQLLVAARHFGWAALTPGRGLAAPPPPSTGPPPALHAT